ncbi:hypothetical protein BDB00DRAFT_792572 [Zychaea mexicana]|uniref:uncharacterized protein n=1 Tax=Zychaea mexicana TaxID=64656 RepID=UPI0022FE6046|nr:uncharacterized protein BDB00DRAFT_792572 [Zychaea mexicana]KAI9484849.1 hypothetical protein BDB00DRAFT_792572 [Zychaea mexicana]
MYSSLYVKPDATLKKLPLASITYITARAAFVLALAKTLFMRCRPTFFFLFSFSFTPLVAPGLSLGSSFGSGSSVGPGLASVGPGLVPVGPGLVPVGPGLASVGPGLVPVGPGLVPVGPGLTLIDTRQSTPCIRASAIDNSIRLFSKRRLFGHGSPLVGTKDGLGSWLIDLKGQMIWDT